MCFCFVSSVVIAAIICVGDWVLIWKGLEPIIISPTMKAQATLILALLLTTVAVAQQTKCEQFVEKLINDIIDMKLSSLPLPSIMYSGITTNNPGQM